MNLDVQYHNVEVMRRLTVSQEGVTDSMRHFMPSLFQGLKSAFTGDLMPSDAVQFTRDQRKFLEMIEKHNYFDLQPLKVYTPESLKASYTQYSAQLMMAVERTVSGIDALVENFSVLIANLVTNRGSQLSTKDVANIYKRVGDDRKQTAAALDACFDFNQHLTESTYGRAVSRNADWNDVFKNVIMTGDRINTVDRAKLKKQLAGIASSMDVLIKMQEDGKLDDIAGEMVTAIAEGSWQVAKEIEYYSILHYRVIAFDKAVEDSVVRLKKILADTPVKKAA